MSHLSDEKLVEKVRGGDIDAYRHLVKRYEKLVFGVAFHSLGNAEDARDVAQDVFIRAFLRLEQVRDFSRTGSWLRQITVNECRAWAGRRRIFEELREDGRDPLVLAHPEGQGLEAPPEEPRAVRIENRSGIEPLLPEPLGEVPAVEQERPAHHVGVA